MLHGQEGRGRFKAFALGAVVDWKVVYEAGSALSRYDISILEREIERVRITDEQPAPGGERGVTVVISELKRQFSSLRPDAAELSEIFAIYLKDYRTVSISIAGERIDPNRAIAGTWEFDLTPIVDEEGAEHRVILEVIEWRRQTRKTLYLCSERLPPVTSRNPLPRRGLPFLRLSEIELHPQPAWRRPARPRRNGAEPRRRH